MRLFEPKPRTYHVDEMEGGGWRPTVWYSVYAHEHGPTLATEAEATAWALDNLRDREQAVAEYEFEPEDC